MINIHQQQVVHSAKRLGIQVEDFSKQWKMNCVRLTHSGKSIFVINGRIFPSLTVSTLTVVNNKQATKDLLQEIQMPVLPGIVLENPDQQKSAISEFLEKHAPCIIKPLFGSHGEGFAANISSLEGVKGYFGRNKKQCKSYLMEPYYEGIDLRIQAVGGKLIAACQRMHAAVTGDGKHTVEELIREKNEIKYKQNPQIIIKIDQETQGLLEAKGMSIKTVPAQGEKVVLKHAANIGQGGDPIDLTDEVHSTYTEWIKQIGSKFELEIFAVDVITSDHTADPVEHARILEINSKPFWAHHTFSDRRQHDVAQAILRSEFEIE